MRLTSNRTILIEIIERLRTSDAGPERAERVNSAIKKLNEGDETPRSKRTVVDVVLILILMAVFVVPIQTMNLSSILALAVVFVLGVVIVVWFRWALPRRSVRYSIGIRKSCSRCRYSLDGHESVLGDDIWVGPEVCPECGERYPAIG